MKKNENYHYGNTNPLLHNAHCAKRISITMIIFIFSYRFFFGIDLNIDSLFKQSFFFAFNRFVFFQLQAKISWCNKCFSKTMNTVICQNNIIWY